MFSRSHPYLFFILIFSTISASAVAIIVISILFVFGARDSGYDDLKAGGEKVGIIEIKGVIADSKDVIFKVLVPGAIPSIITGMRIGLGLGWMTLVAAEFSGVKQGYGLGYMIMTARDILRPDEILAGMLVIGLTGLFIDGILRLLEKSLIRWRK